MAVFYDLDQLPVFRNAVITIGTFDGVHLGHQLILNEVVQLAKQREGESILVTFHPHPRQLLYPTQHLGIITPLQDKVALVHATGINHIVVVPFTHHFAALSATQYVEEFLMARLHPKCIVTGYDHRFGHDRAGNTSMLQQYSPLAGFDVVEIPAQLIEEAAVSSTRIRKALSDGRVEEAAGMLGRNYTFRGLVVHGKKLGRTIGYPTINLDFVEKAQIVPGNGVYTVQVNVGGTLFGGMMSIGYNPTVTDEKTIKVEVNIFDFSNEIYGAEVEVIIVKKIRNEEKFASLDALIKQLDEDKQVSLVILGSTAMRE